MKKLILLTLLASSGLGFGQPAESDVQLTPGERLRLEKQGVLITGHEYRQVFEPYIDSRVPVFITSDSIINAYHALFEESIAAMERSQASRLAQVLEKMSRELGRLENLYGESERATLVLGVALKLFGRSIDGASDREQRLIENEAIRVQAAKGIGKPVWLGAPEPDFLGFDYARFKPVGLYAGEVRMEQYFRALSWLQAVPFRLSNDEELKAIALLGACASGKDTAIFQRHAEFLGVVDDWDLRLAAKRLDPRYSVEVIREQFAKSRESGEIEDPKISDHLRISHEQPGAIAEPNFRIVSAWRLPDVALMQLTSLQGSEPGRLPGGLDLGAALGSDLARGVLQRESPEALAVIDGHRALFAAGDSIYHDYLQCLAALLDDADPSAPVIFHSTAWQAKSLNSSFAGWTQLRYAWALQSKSLVSFLSGSRAEPGFIEPDPQFFEKFSAMITRTKNAFEKDSAIGIAPEQLAEELKLAIATLRKADTALKRKDWDGVEKLVAESIPIARLWPAVEMGTGLSFKHSLDLPAYAAEQLETLLPGAESELGARLLSRAIAHGEGSLLSRWRKLQYLSRRLHELASKQLDGSPMDKTDEKFFLEYGREIAHVMFYEGNSYVSPRDDAPRVVSIFGRGGSKRHAATGRPRAIYLLYPRGGEKILCRGAITPYYEIDHPSLLGNAEWMELLGSEENRPETASFTSAVFASPQPSEPDRGNE